ncbi:hypothetical protein PS15m_010266 [Mucor circinelloides]
MQVKVFAYLINTLFFRLFVFLGPRSQKTTSASSKIITNPQNNTTTTTTTGPVLKPVPTVTSSSRLTPSTKAALSNRPSKLPVAASKKRRFSHIKATVVPARSSPRLRIPHTKPTAHPTIETTDPMNPQTIAETNSSTDMIMSQPDSSTTISIAEQIAPPLDGVRLPPTDDIHAFAQMPSWIQDIYLRLSKSENAIATHTAQLDQIQDLLRRNQELQSALDIANRRIAELEVQSQKADPTPSAPTRSNLPSSSQRADGPSASKWADLAAAPPPANPPKTSRPQAPTAKTTSQPKTSPKTKAKRPLTLEQLDRFYSAPSATHGYQFLYFTSRGRERISKIRAGFHVLGLQQGRILDIHYPENNTISFLVHNDYADTVIAAMSKLPSSTLITDFDPCASSLLRDPKYHQTTDSSFLTSEATRIFQERLIRIVQRLHVPHVQLAVARDFCFSHQWITNDQYRELYHCVYPDKAHKTDSSLANDDVHMDDTVSQNSATQPAASLTSTSPADGVSAPLV